MFAALSARLRRWWTESSRASKSGHRVSLGLETLETRTVPSNMPAISALPPDNQVFLATVYQGELQRPIDSVGLSSWGNQLNQNVGRAQVVGAILNSNEYLSREISTDFDALLSRDPDPTGLLHFMQALQNGATPQEVQARIMGSDEFFARVSGDLTSFLQAYGATAQVGSVARSELTAYRFLNAVYGEVLNRPVDANGLAGWFALAGDATGRTEIVREVEASPEATQRVVATLYQDTLGRAPDAGGLTYWAGQLQQGVSESAVLAAVLGSDEFFSRMQSYTRQSNTSDPNIAAATFISEAQLFKSRPALVPAAPPVVVVAPGGDNSGFDTPPADNTGGDVLGADNSGGSTAIPDNSVTPTPVSDPSSDDSSSDNSTTASTDTPSTDCSCDSGTPVTTGSSSDTGSADSSSDPSSGF
ncbi:MAG TPA: DUF4214 domain-containing protein [Gemmataceae bacterium]|nr:DUF4214 domain-containing protein [Gemmataceae bacterium]